MKESGQLARGDTHIVGAQAQQLAAQNPSGPMKAAKAQQSLGAAGATGGNHLQSHSFDFR
jgi:hypothetical protein